MDTPDPGSRAATALTAERFDPKGMTWYEDPDCVPLAGYDDLVLAAKAAHFGNQGLFVHWNVRRGRFPWYENSEAGWTNRSNDLVGISHNSALLPAGQSRRIGSTDEMIGFCRFLISTLLPPIIEFESNVANDPCFWLSNSNGSWPPIFQRYDAGALINDIYRICTCLLRPEHVPSRPGSTNVAGLNAFLDRVHIECLNHSIKSDGKPGYLGLIVDFEHRTIRREGQKNVTVDLRNAPALWDTFRVFFKAEDADATEDAWKSALPGEWSSARMHRSNLRDRLRPLAITIPDGGRRFVDDGITRV
jgi:hypothetical protein